MQTQERKETIHAVLERLARRRDTPVVGLAIEAWVSSEPLPFGERTRGTHRRLEVGDSWASELFDCAWFSFAAQVPEGFAGAELTALLDISGEMLVVDDAGQPVEGLTNQSSHFDYSLGRPGKTALPVAPSGDGMVQVWADGALNDLFGVVQDEGRVVQAEIVVRDAPIGELMHNISFLVDLAEGLGEGDRQDALLSELAEVSSLADDVSDADSGVQSALEQTRRLIERTEGVPGDPAVVVTAIGHAHMDLAWLWPVRETHRKGARTFATALRNMERYPEYLFGASQAQLYAWIKEDHPSLYREVSERVADGRWDLLGGFWVECDLNLISSESLVRQLLYGQRYFREEFGASVRNAILPDTFGFSQSLPQILKKAGIDFFVTMKPNWHGMNSFPHHSFMWRGIDGTIIPTHILPEGTYNGPATPSAVLNAVRSYEERNVSGQMLAYYGIGDGGGGPGESHLESLERCKMSPAVPSVRQAGMDEFYAAWIKDAASFPVWDDEIYLQKHHGSFTSQGRAKKLNRESEAMLAKVETLQAIHEMLGTGVTTGRSEIEEIWKETLLYQFHDILPGTSIRRVYEECIPRYEANLETLRGFLHELLARLPAPEAPGGDTSSRVFNFTPHSRHEWVAVSDGWAGVTIPPIGYSVVPHSPGEAPPACRYDDAGEIENALLRVRFAEDGSLVSVWDKDRQLECLQDGGVGNRITVYQDDGDCWDFPADYRDHRLGEPELVSRVFHLDGPHVWVEQAYQFRASTIRQEVRLTAGSRRIDFVTDADWHDGAVMLKAGFETATTADQAKYEIQSGYISRMTDGAERDGRRKDEVPALRWADLSDERGGVALLNDGKSGYRIVGSAMELTLLRTGRYPSAVPIDELQTPVDELHTDLGRHRFVYSLLPHAAGDLECVYCEAAFLNSPCELAEPAVSSAVLPGGAVAASFFRLDSPQAIIQSVKPAEDGHAVIVRMHESEGSPCACRLETFVPPRHALLCSLIEDAESELAVSGRGVELRFGPFEIVTVRLEF
jgi:alpha-mannosidase